MLISTSIFSIVLYGLERIRPVIFSFSKKIPSKWKDNWLVRMLVFLLIATLIQVFFVLAQFNQMVGIVISGFFLALINIIFRKDIE